MKRHTRNITGHNYTIYCDNYFTSATLFHDLQDKIYACGTYNATRKCYPSDLKAKAKSGIGSRGSTEYRQDGNILVTLAGYKNPLCLIHQLPAPLGDNCFSEAEKWIEG